MPFDRKNSSHTATFLTPLLLLFAHIFFYILRIYPITRYITPRTRYVTTRFLLYSLITIHLLTTPKYFTDLSPITLIALHELSLPHYIILTHEIPLLHYLSQV
jgi:hypothetical protein